MDLAPDAGLSTWVLLAGGPHGIVGRDVGSHGEFRQGDGGDERVVGQDARSVICPSSSSVLVSRIPVG